MRCAIWYHLHNLKNVRNTHGAVLLFVKLQVCARVSFLIKLHAYSVCRSKSFKSDLYLVMEKLNLPAIRRIAFYMMQVILWKT